MLQNGNGRPKSNAAAIARYRGRSHKEKVPLDDVLIAYTALRHRIAKLGFRTYDNLGPFDATNHTGIFWCEVRDPETGREIRESIRFRPTKRGKGFLLALGAEQEFDCSQLSDLDTIFPEDRRRFAEKFSVVFRDKSTRRAK
jgi:hypothetical protein